MTSLHRAYIGLGSNLSDPQGQIRQACEELSNLPGIGHLRCSSLYRTAPIGFADQPDFINAVAEVDTILSPAELLETLAALEAGHARVRRQRNGPRTLDLDILLYEDWRIDSDTLVIPHPRAHQRAFVLAPLVELAPDCEIPGLGRAALWLTRCADQAIARIADVVAQPTREAVASQSGSLA